MSAGILFGKRTWIGFGVSVGVLLVLLLFGAFFIVRGMLPMNAASPWVWVSYGLAALISGRVAATRQDQKLCALITGGMLYGFAWLLALCCECTLDFAANGIGITIAVFAGVLIALLGNKKKKKGSRGRKVKRTSVRTVRR